MADPEPTHRKPATSAVHARKRMLRKVLAEWRGVYIPPDLRGYERKVGDVVDRILKKAGIEDRLDHEQVSEHWEATVGEFLGKHSRPVSLRRGILTVAVLQASVRYDLERRWKKDIVLRLQERYGKDKVRDVRFQNG